jgi:hypothetical protein
MGGFRSGHVTRMGEKKFVIDWLLCLIRCLKLCNPCLTKLVVHLIHFVKIVSFIEVIRAMG